MNAESPGAAYRVFSLLLFPLWLIHAFFHGRNYGQSDYLKRRLLDSVGRSEKSFIWIHASSVGEVSALTPLVEALIDEGEHVFFTSFTASGLQTIQKNFGARVQSTVIPVDFLPCCRGFIRRHRFKLCLLMETELWPELLYQAANNKIPVVQINARLSRKSTDAPIFFRYLLRRALANIQYHLARNELDKQRLIGLGALDDKIKVVGNLKSGVTTDETYINLINQDYLLLASTHEGEEALFLDQRKALKTLIVIAPRHPARSGAIQKYLSAQSINYAVRSKDEPISKDTEVYLADTLGELQALMAHAELVIMGGSFDQTGGHNLIEPASLGRPIITGPSDANIVNDIRLLGDAVVQVADIRACWEKLGYFLNNPAKAEALGRKARKIILSQSDILGTYLQEIKQFL
jgi:3-deoxy-D-manno-octulosonic-acid transferase